jgi:hypothetical protein
MAEDMSSANRRTYLSAWKEKTSSTDEVCRTAAEILVPYSDRAEVDAVTDYHESAEGQDFLARMNQCVEARHAQKLATDPKYARRVHAPPLLDVPLDLSDREQAELFVISSALSISATLFRRDEHIFETTDSGQALALLLHASEADEIALALENRNMSFAEYLSMQPARARRWWR